MTEKLVKLRGSFEQRGIDGLLITSKYNRRYMTNFTGSAGVVVISKEKAVFITDFRYIEQATKQTEGFEIVKHTGPIAKEIASVVEQLGIKALGFEEQAITYADFSTYQKEISAQLVPVSGLVENLRLIKTSEEIKILKEAAKLTDEAFNHILSYLKPGVTELEVSNELEFYMRKHGATSSSFDTIVASGYRSALPHGAASEKVIKEGEFVTLDFGAYYKGYCSDITRTVAVGDVSDELKNIYDIVLKAQLRSVDGIKKGITGVQADALARDYITEHGYGEYFGHSTGHGIGLEVHEGPALSTRSATVLEPGMVVTVEPGIYVPNVGGVRIEDDLLITDEGNENLTYAPKELIIL
ncbi:Xaa-Pro peptidase family protein [Priestia endophytica]|jgi:Xaa-Pro aminopeptidase|uniref:M24 family metallopeptidase n=1 Tax=Priestia endophytica TaxID=135735 RepID=UPI00203CEA96|nr:Xaa-Pro peptidase family protein [Priestia endophytica]MCM3539567.1 Xaa-Pro peptidase family protein [Priestia endophytica]